VIAQNPLHQTTDSINKLTAAYLCQEGIEIVRNIRDENFLTGITPWNTGLSNGIYKVDYDDPSLSSPGSFLQKGNDFYNYGGPGSSDTIFTRTITITEPGTPECPLSGCLNIFVTVNYGTGKSVTVQENLYNWYIP
jgi:hypothetical protein